MVPSKLAKHANVVVKTVAASVALAGCQIRVAASGTGNLLVSSLQQPWSAFRSLQTCITSHCIRNIMAHRQTVGELNKANLLRQQ